MVEAGVAAGVQDCTSDAAPVDVPPEWPSGDDPPQAGAGTAAGAAPEGSESVEVVVDGEEISHWPPRSDAGCAALSCPACVSGTNKHKVCHFITLCRLQAGSRSRKLCLSLALPAGSDLLLDAACHRASQPQSQAKL